jgi:predicted phage terminase large subunit-like protein
MTNVEQVLHDEIVRNNFDAFVQRCVSTLNPGDLYQVNWHTKAITYRLEKVRRGEIKRLILNLPPRHLKSTIAAVAFPLYILGHDPTRRVIVISHSLDLAVKHGNDFRTVLNEPWFQRAFPGTRIMPGKNNEYEVATTRAGFRISTAVDAALIGRGGHFLIIDDALSPIDALSDSRRKHVNSWYNNTLVTRLDDKINGVIIVIMQRLHTEDLCGFLLNGPEKWDHLALPAIAQKDEEILIGDGEHHSRRIGDVLHPAREPKSSLDIIRAQMGEDNFNAQYQQSPIPVGGGMIKREWVQRYEQLPARRGSAYIIQSWDLALKGGPESSYSVCTTWLIQDGNYYLMDVLRGRWDYPTLKRRAIEHAGNHRPARILVEDAMIGSALVAELNAAKHSAVGIKPERDKRTRMALQSIKFEKGLVFFPKTAPGLTELEVEFFAFPNSVFDDQVDSISQALAYNWRPWPWSDDAINNLGRLAYRF